MSPFELSPEQRAKAERALEDWKWKAAQELHALNWAEPNGNGATAAPAAPSSWAPVDLLPVLAGEQVEPEPSILHRPDGVALLYPERIHQVSGEPEACKGWMALGATAELLEDRLHVVYIDFEDTGASIVARLRALGCPDSTIVEGLTYMRPHEPLTDTTARADLESALEAAPALVVIDGVTEALTIHGLDLGDNADIARWLELLPRPSARCGAAVLLVDHVVKDKDARGRYSIGAQHKLAGIDVAYALEVIEPFGRGRDGLVKVSVSKDRPGYVRQHADDGRIADMRLASTLDTGAVTVTLDPPDGQAGGFRPTVLMGRTWAAVAAEPGITTKGIRAAVKGKSDAKDLALSLLVSEGFVGVEKDGQARRHHTAKPFTEDTRNADRAPVPLPCPSVPGHGSIPTVPVPPKVTPPVGGGTGARSGTSAEGTPGSGQPCPASCTCRRPARSPRAGPDQCMICRRPIGDLELLAGGGS